MSTEQRTSFQKVSKKKLTTIRGTKASISNNLFITSTGVPSLDVLLGGGVALGTLFLIEEDAYAAYSHVLQKYFLAEGVMCGHKLFYSSLDKDPKKVLEELPAATDDELKDSAISSEASGASSEQQMNIAWRYKNKPQVQSDLSSHSGHYFDLTKQMPLERLAVVEQTTLDLSRLCADSIDASSESAYGRLLNACSQLVDDHTASCTHTKDARNVLRIAISGLGSPLWGDCNALPQLFVALRGLARSSLCTLQITVPAYVCQNNTLCRRLERLSDYAIKLESFSGSEKEKNSAFKDYHGMLHVRHLARLNSLLCGPAEQREGELAFKLRRKKFTIETLHLPPELGEAASRPQEDAVRPHCAPQSTLFSANKSLDF